MRAARCAASVVFPLAVGPSIVIMVAKIEILFETKK
jgi:hypothetical protein